MSESKNLDNIPLPEINGCQSNGQFPIGMQVLAIDANIVSLTYLVTLLRKCRYQVTATTKAAEALEILRRKKEEYDIVLTDVVRLDIDGFKLLEIIRLEMDLPVVMVSTNDDQANIMRGIQNGAQDFLLKPVRLLEIMNIWQHVVRKNLSADSQRSFKKNIVGKAAEIPVNFDGEEETMKMRDEEAPSKTCKKSRLNWSAELHSMFLKAVQQLGGVEEAKPNQIRKTMNVPGVTRENIASHLQKYRITLRKHNGTASQKANKIVGVNSSRTTTSPNTDSSGKSDLHKLAQNIFERPTRTKGKTSNSLSQPSKSEQLIRSSFPSMVQYPTSFNGPNKQILNLHDFSIDYPNLSGHQTHNMVMKQNHGQEMIRFARPPMENHFPLQELEFPSTFHPGVNSKNASPPAILAPFSSSNNGMLKDHQVGTNNNKACFSCPSQVLLRDDSTGPRDAFSQRTFRIQDFSNPSQMQGPEIMDSGRGDTTEIATQLLVDPFLMVPWDDLQS